MTLLDVLDQLDAEIRDGEAHAVHLKHIGAGKEAISEVLADVASLKRQWRNLSLRGYFAVTGTAIPEAEPPEVMKKLRQRINGEWEP